MYHQKVWSMWNWVAKHSRSSKLFSFAVGKMVPHYFPYMEWVRDNKPDFWAAHPNMQEGYDRMKERVRKNSRA